ncbi:MAG: hypothetical protein ABFS34_13280 [Gemmatimonadota bacterium]
MGIALPAFPQGTRVRVRRGGLPLEEGLVGRTGVVIQATQYARTRAGVLLDDEREARFFDASELEVTELPALDSRRDAVRARLARP